MVARKRKKAKACPFCSETDALPLFQEGTRACIICATCGAGGPFIEVNTSLNLDDEAIYAMAVKSWDKAVRQKVTRAKKALVT